MKILLIEDDIQLSTTIAKFLTLRGYDVITTLDGKKAIEYIEMTNFDFYIIDINIPHYNGLEITSYIRNKSLLIPIIIITASLDIQSLQIAYKNGCNEYIKKPFHLEELEIRINHLLQQPTLSI